MSTDVTGFQIPTGPPRDRDSILGPRGDPLFGSQCYSRTPGDKPEGKLAAPEENDRMRAVEDSPRAKEAAAPAAAAPAAKGKSAGGTDAAVLVEWERLFHSRVRAHGIVCRWPREEGEPLRRSRPRVRVPGRRPQACEDLWRFGSMFGFSTGNAEHPLYLQGCQVRKQDCQIRKSARVRQPVRQHPPKSVTKSAKKSVSPPEVR
eukprot:gene14200-biopygen6171